MKTIQKILVAASSVAAIGFAVLEARLAAHWVNKVAAMTRQLDPLLEQFRQLRQERDEMTNKLATTRQDNDRLRQDVADLPKLRGEVTRLRSDSEELTRLRAPATAGTTANANDSTPAATEDWRLPIVHQLRQAIDQMPERKIPELRFLTDEDWLRAAQTASLVGLDADDDVRYALSTLRSAAKDHFVHMMWEALDGYTQVSGGQLPADLAQLQPYFHPPVDDSILQRYQILQTGNVQDLPPDQPWVAEKAPMDEDHDLLFRIFAKGRIKHQPFNAAERERQALMKLAR